MSISALKRMRNRAPFRPFQLHLTSGETLPVGHPESMSLPEDETEMFVLWTHDGWNLIDAEQVTRVSVPRRVAKAA